MKRTILSIYPANNGNVNVEITRDSRTISFATKRSNIFSLLLKIQFKLFESWFKEKLLFEHKVDTNAFPE